MAIEVVVDLAETVAAMLDVAVVVVDVVVAKLILFFKFYKLPKDQNTYHNRNVFNMLMENAKTSFVGLSP